MTEFLLKYGDLIALLSGIGTFISALIAVFTLVEVKKQRLSLYQPDILIKSFLVAISKSPIYKAPEELIKYKVCDYNDYSNNYNEIKFDVSPKYKVDNLGFGVAKNIECQWHFDAKKAIGIIENLLPNFYSFTFDNVLDLYFLNNLDDDDFHHSAFAKTDRQNIDFIPPIHIHKHHHYYTIPEIISYTHFLFLIFKMNLLAKSTDNFHFFDYETFKFPKPVLIIKYEDLNGKKYKKKYEFSITAVGTQTNEKMDMTKEFCYLTFQMQQS